MSKLSPGPWKYDKPDHPSGGTTLRDANGETVASGWDDGLYVHSPADAAAIAKVPEMVAMLRKHTEDRACWVVEAKAEQGFDYSNGCGECLHCLTVALLKGLPES